MALHEPVWRLKYSNRITRLVARHQELKVTSSLSEETWMKFKKTGQWRYIIKIYVTTLLLSQDLNRGSSLHQWSLTLPCSELQTASKQYTYISSRPFYRPTVRNDTASCKATSSPLPASGTVLSVNCQLVRYKPVLNVWAVHTWQVTVGQCGEDKLCVTTGELNDKFNTCELAGCDSETDWKTKWTSSGKQLFPVFSDTINKNNQF
jgi:hypothetical protein